MNMQISLCACSVCASVHISGKSTNSKTSDTTTQSCVRDVVICKLGGEFHSYIHCMGGSRQDAEQEAVVKDAGGLTLRLFSFVLLLRHN